LNDSISTHNSNSSDINYLYDYYKGNQEIQSKSKETRVEINNKITENRAYEIVSFKKGYTFGEPVQYIARGTEKSIVDAINKLNDFMIECDKNELDSELAEWFYVCGVAYRMALPNKNWDVDFDESPFKIYTLDPRNTFVVRFNDLEKEIAMAVTYVELEGNNKLYSVYTKDTFYTIDDLHGIISSQPIYTGLPVVEYVHNNARLGAFEVVISLLDAINSVQSNRLDDVEQAVNSFMAVFGADMDEKTYKQIQEWKMMVLPDGSDVKYLTSSLHQGDVQTYVDNLYHTILTICGMPSVESGGNGGDNGVAVHLRNGWQNAETQAKSVEKTFKRSERKLLKLVLRILNNVSENTLSLSNIDIKFARRYTDNIYTKAQTLALLLDSGIKPDIAIATCGIWNDPTDVALQSKPYLEKWELNDVLQENGQDFSEVENADQEVIQQV
jgi:SPP1 family phage portal protein